MSERYLLQQSKDKGFWVATDKVNGIVVKFQECRFNDTQKVTMLEEISNSNPLTIAGQMRELTDWLIENHKDIL